MCLRSYRKLGKLGFESRLFSLVSEVIVLFNRIDSFDIAHNFQRQIKS